ncbi:hypothetical protein DFH07DRAFT_757638, partial [Mycena maculata]
HQVLSITDKPAVTFIVGAEDIYRFPKPNGVRVWFEKTLGHGESRLFYRTTRI